MIPASGFSHINPYPPSLESAKDKPRLEVRGGLKAFGRFDSRDNIDDIEMFFCERGRKLMRKHRIPAGLYITCPQGIITLFYLRG